MAVSSVFATGAELLMLRDVHGEEDYAFNKSAESEARSRELEAKDLGITIMHSGGVAAARKLSKGVAHCFLHPI